MLSRIRRLFKLDSPHYVSRVDHNIKLTEVKLAELELSQQPLRRAIADTGFFLGDALRIDRQVPRESAR